MGTDTVVQDGRFTSFLRRQWKWGAAALALFVLYTLFGFLVVPWIVRNQIVEQARTTLHREATVGEVRFNPFTLALTIGRLKLADRDGVDLAAFDLLRADLEVSGIFRRALRFKEIRVEHPVIAARILADGKPSVSDLMESSSDAPGEPFQPPRLIVDRLAVNTGVVQFSDATHHPTHQSRFEPLNLDVENLITIPQEEGSHTITIGVGEGAELHWTGQQTVEPLRLTGKLDIKGLDLRGLWAYFGAGQMLDVADGRADLTLPYDISRGTDRQMHATVDAASATVRTLVVRAAGDTADWLTIPEVHVTNVKAGWPASSVEVGGVRIARPHAVARLEPDGALNWSKALPPAAESSTSKTAWTFRLASFDVEGGSVAFEDLSIEPATKLELADLVLHASDITGDAAKPIPVNARARLGDRGTIEGSGTIAPSPVTADVKFAVSDIDLVPLRPYVSSFPGARFGSGTATLQGQVAVSDGGQALKIGANGNVDNVELQDMSGERLVAWQTMAIDGLTIEDPPNRMRIRALRVDQPFAKILIDKDGNLNLTRLATAAESPAAGTPDESAGPPRTVEINTVELRNATAEYWDQSMLLEFRAKIHSARGTIRDLSSFASAPATLAIEGRVDDTGYVKSDGTLRLADPMAASEIRVEFRSIEMPALTPYFAEFAGYRIRQGVLDLDVRYVVSDRRLLGNHKLLARDLNLGDKVDGSKAAPLPVRLAIALLKDKDGRINLDVPIEGTVDSPEFAYRKVFWAAVRTILGNAAKAPFRALGRLFGRDEDDLELVEFDPGRSDLLPAEQATLGKIAEQIAQRRDLTLSVEGRFDPVADTEALKRAKLERLIESRRDTAAAAAAAAGGSTLETILEALFVEQFSADALAAERQRFTQAPAAGAPAAGAPAAGAAVATTPPPAAAAPPQGAQASSQPAEPTAPGTPAAAAAFDAARFYESLRARLLEAQSVTPADLSALAAARSASIVSALTGSGAVEAARVTTSEPTAVKRKKANSNRIAAEMTMSADGGAEKAETN
ncbi:MAG TPA: DUF748 domain-containing protein [Vicinamibacterales bacterium]|nr:DUF748 domain-containing protein [Vicinamibacterales bacterium]